MQLTIYKDYEELSRKAAEKITAVVKNNPAAVLCLATGDTPRLTYKLMVQTALEQKTDFSFCSFIALDEWVNISPESEGSCHHFLQTNIFKPLHISPSNTYLFNSLSEDLEKECSKMDALVKEKGGIDLMLVGVGMNGHIGFNEPGASIDNYTHVVDLDETTQKVGQKYFNQATEIKQGITLGLKHFLESKKAIMMASGTKKATVIMQALKEEITTNMPASIIRMHHNGEVMIDTDAASLL
jgi:glucosamine-6-phosphate isomerase